MNEGWSWSLDPADFEFAELTTEVCDGNPSDVESGVADERSLLPVVGASVVGDPSPRP